MIYLLGLCAAFCAFLLLLTAMQRHQPDIFGARLSARTGRHLRLGGFALIFLCWLTDMLGFGWAVGTVTTLGHLALAAGLAIVTLHWRVAQLRKMPASKGR